MPQHPDGGKMYGPQKQNQKQKQNNTKQKKLDSLPFFFFSDKDENVHSWGAIQERIKKKKIKMEKEIGVVGITVISVNAYFFSTAQTHGRGKGNVGSGVLL